MPANFFPRKGQKRADLCLLDVPVLDDAHNSRHQRRKAHIRLLMLTHKLPVNYDTHEGELSGTDVGPVLRRFLGRVDDRFDDRLPLTLPDELIRCQVPKRAVGATLIIVTPPGFDDDLCLGERGELVHVQTFVPQAPVKRFNEGIFDGFSRSYEVELHTSTIRPILESTGLEFRPMIHRDGARPLALERLQLSTTVRIR